MEKGAILFVAALLALLGTVLAESPVVELAPFKFIVTEVTRSSNGKMLFKDIFKGSTKKGETPAAARYLVNIGRVKSDVFRPNRVGLVLNQANTTPTYNSYVAMVSLPFDGTYGVPATRLNNSELSVTLDDPRITGNEKIRLGIMDDNSLHGIAVIGIGGHFPGGGGGGGGGGGKLFLEREEWPEVQGEITLASADLGDLKSVKQLELTLRIGEAGQFSGIASVRHVDGTAQSFTLTPDENKEPREFFAKRSRIDQSLAEVSAVLYVEALPKPQIFVVSPSQIEVGKKSFSFRIHGTGFGVDTSVEVYPGQEALASPMKVVSVKQVRDGLLEVTAELAKAPEAHVEAFTVRVTSGGQSVWRDAALRFVK